MVYLRSLKIKKKPLAKHEFPWSVPIFAEFDELSLDQNVTLLVGENGSGKSTMIETIAMGIKAISMGSTDLSRDPTLKQIKEFTNSFRFVWNKRPRTNFFFRSEDFFGFTKRIIEQEQDLKNLEKHYDDTLSGYGRDLAVGMARGQRSALESRYGENPDGYSHGQTLIGTMKNRLVPRGLYLMDEPETPLSPVSQLALISLLKEATENDCQFIIATHSPILMAFPGALIYKFDEAEILESNWDEIDHVTITRAFLNDPEGFLRRL
ncbi:MAG: AAA family ATPase [Calditrichaeota bacterium]|nr:AAA family ATPase [Calditrichota bacterium]MBT7789714.1 AAA family ATPase [Calditrichota bacterium]